jgi:hypothetical protein
MGMFDSLMITCKKCKRTVEFQSKASSCCLSEFEIDNCPDVILADLNGQHEECECGNVITIRSKTVAIVEQ